MISQTRSYANLPVRSDICDSVIAALAQDIVGEIFFSRYLVERL